MATRWWDRIPKKLCALALGLLVQSLPLPAEIKDKATELIMVYIGAQGVADLRKPAPEAKETEK